jgi:chemotaxis protein CheX
VERDLLGIIEAATQDVMTTMAGFTVTCDRATSPDRLPLSGVLSRFDLAGVASGTGFVVCSPDLACRITSRMLQMECTAIDEDVLDAMGEIANMIIGNVKNVFERELGPISLSTPSVSILGSLEEWPAGDAITVAFTYKDTPLLALSFSDADTH